MHPGIRQLVRCQRRGCYLDHIGRVTQAPRGILCFFREVASQNGRLAVVGTYYWWGELLVGADRDCFLVTKLEHCSEFGVSDGFDLQCS